MPTTATLTIEVDSPAKSGIDGLYHAKPGSTLTGRLILYTGEEETLTLSASGIEFLFGGSITVGPSQAGPSKPGASLYYQLIPTVKPAVHHNFPGHNRIIFPFQVTLTNDSSKLPPTDDNEATPIHYGLQAKAYLSGPEKIGADHPQAVLPIIIDDVPPPLIPAPELFEPLVMANDLKILQSDMCPCDSFGYWTLRTMLAVPGVCFMNHEVVSVQIQFENLTPFTIDRVEFALIEKIEAPGYTMDMIPGRGGALRISKVIKWRDHVPIQVAPNAIISLEPSFQMRSLQKNIKVGATTRTNVIEIVLHLAGRTEYLSFEFPIHSPYHSQVSHMRQLPPIHSIPKVFHGNPDADGCGGQQSFHAPNYKSNQARWLSGPFAKEDPSLEAAKIALAQQQQTNAAGGSGVRGEPDPPIMVEGYAPPSGGPQAPPPAYQSYQGASSVSYGGWANPPTTTASATAGPVSNQLLSMYQPPPPTAQYMPAPTLTQPLLADGHALAEPEPLAVDYMRMQPHP